MGTAAADENLRQIASRAEVRAVTDAARRASMDAVFDGVKDGMVEGVMAAIGKAGVVASAPKKTKKKRKRTAVAKANTLAGLKSIGATLRGMVARVNAGVAEDEEPGLEAVGIYPVGERHVRARDAQRRVVEKANAKADARADAEMEARGGMDMVGLAAVPKLHLARKAKAEAAERLLREEDESGMEDVGLASAAEVGRQVHRF